MFSHSAAVNCLLIVWKNSGSVWPPVVKELHYVIASFSGYYTSFISVI